MNRIIYNQMNSLLCSNMTRTFYIIVIANMFSLRFSSYWTKRNISL